MFRIKKTKDLSLVRSLDFAIFGEEEAESDYANAAYTWWVVWQGSDPVAFCGLEAAADRRGPYGVLLRAGVVPEARGQGLQRRMIRVRDAQARKLELECVITYTDRYNVRSSNNLIKEGYLLYNPEHKWGLSQGLYFWKAL